MSQYLNIDYMREQWKKFEKVDWCHAPLREVIAFNQGLMGGLTVGQYVRWFQSKN